MGKHAGGGKAGKHKADCEKYKALDSRTKNKIRNIKKQVKKSNKDLQAREDLKRHVKN